MYSASNLVFSVCGKFSHIFPMILVSSNTEASGFSSLTD